MASLENSFSIHPLPPKTIVDLPDGDILATYHIDSGGMWKLFPGSLTDDGGNRDFREIHIHIREGVPSTNFNIEKLAFMSNDEVISTLSEKVMRGPRGPDDTMILTSSDNIPSLHKAMCPHNFFWLKVETYGPV